MGGFRAGGLREWVNGEGNWMERELDGEGIGWRGELDGEGIG
jgi:hypothetical protein